MSSTPESLEKFVQFCQQHLRGDEKGEAQVFLDRLFRAFGHEGAMGEARSETIEAGATYEERVKKGSKTGKTGFADLVWKPRVLIEMKKRGEDLNKNYAQVLFAYVPQSMNRRLAATLVLLFHENVRSRNKTTE